MSRSLDAPITKDPELMIPTATGKTKVEPITELFRTFQDVAPLLYKLDETLAGDDARHFLDAMQRYFSGVNILNEDVDQDLLYATDNLLRVVSTAELHPDYRFGKFEVAREHFEKYGQRVGRGHEIGPVTGRDPLRVEEQYLHVALMQMVERIQGLRPVDVFVLRINVALLEYGRQQESGKDLYPQIGTNLHHTLRQYLEFATISNLNASLPDTLDHILIADMKGYCRWAWEALKMGEKLSFKEFASMWLARLRDACRFRNG